MEENIPLENESRKKFEKTVKSIKKILKKDNPVPKQIGKVEKEKVVKKKSPKRADDPIIRDRGVVYIGHIPHGFYEDQMKAYFTQFGKVTNTRVARSKKTGKSKGYAFVEFSNKEVAQIVAETMDNYLMDKRLLKAQYVPPEKQRASFFKGKKWVAGKYCPGITNRNKYIAINNREITDEQALTDAKKLLKRLSKVKTKLKTLGIDYDFFQPCDVPEELKNYDPTQTVQPSVKSGEKKAISKTQKRRMRKQKSKSKLASSETKSPKVKKTEENKKRGASVRPFLTKKIDSEDNKKQPMKTKKETATEKVTEKTLEKDLMLTKKGKKKAENGENKKKDKLHMKKEAGGIQKKHGKEKPADKKHVKLLKSQAQELLNSSMVKVVGGKDKALVGKFNKGKKKQK